MMLFQALPFWQQANVESHILAKGIEPGGFAPEMEKCGFKIFHIPLKKFGTLSFIRKFTELLCREKYDIVHIHTESKFFLIALIGILSGAKVVRTVHGIFSFDGIRRIRRCMVYWICRKFKIKIITIGDSVDANEKSYGADTVRLDNWCNTGDFVPLTEPERVALRRELGLPEKVKIISSVGNCAPVKNHELIFEALQIVSASNMDWLYLHIGEETPDQSERILAEKLSVADRTKFLGGKVPLKYLQASDIFLMPSKHEGMAIAGLEALMCGLPTVFSNAPGLVDFKKFNLPNVIYTENDPQSLADAIVFASQKTIDYDGTADLRSHYSVQNGAKRYLEFWEKLLNE